MDDGAVPRGEETAVPRRGTAAAVPLSVLDLSLVPAGRTAADALMHTRELARHVERLGYRRFWLAEHHNMPGIASAATSVIVADVAAATSTIRVGAGGVMLPNHVPLVIAEHYGTLASLHPGRIDLGVGRAPGTDTATARALRREPAAADRFPQDVLELLAHFEAPAPDQKVRAVPGAGLHVPVWMLGSSTFGAQLAAGLGLPFSFASHFAPRLLHEALTIYRAWFTPSVRAHAIERPYAMPGVNVIVAGSDEEARRLFTSLQQAFVNARRGVAEPFPPPAPGFADGLPPWERVSLDEMLTCSFVGSPATVQRDLEAFIARTGADELIVATPVFDPEARFRSLELLAAIHDPRGRQDADRPAEANADQHHG